MAVVEINRWICDKCRTQADVSRSLGFPVGWLGFDLTIHPEQPRTVLFCENCQGSVLGSVLSALGLGNA